MKILRLVLILSLVPGFCYAQKDSSKPRAVTNITINAGAGIPSSLFSSEYNEFGNYAKVGFFMSIQGIYPIHHSWFGFAGLIGYGTNTFDTASYSGTGTFSSFSHGSYKIYTVMPGICAIIPGQNASIEFRILAGNMYFKLPNITYTGELTNSGSLKGHPPVGGTWNIISSGVSAFAYDIGTSIKLNVGKRFLWAFSADFLHSGLNGGINQVTKFSSFTGGINNQTTATFMYVTCFNLTTGIGYKL